MPAVELDKLKLQSANLAGKISRPDIFLPMFRELLDSYSNRTFRTQAAPGRLKATPSYHVPEKVIWQIERDLLAQIKVHPQQQCLEIAVQLWKSKSLEEKMLAISILGRVFALPKEPVLDHFKQWYSNTTDPLLLKMLATAGSRSIRENVPEEWQLIIDEWIESRRTTNLISTLHSVEDALELEGDAYLPQAFELLNRVILRDDGAVLQEMLHLIQVMVKRSRSETAYFIKDLGKGPGKMTNTIERLIKRSIVYFPPEMQKELRSLVQNGDQRETPGI
jgi:hypothetical protein